MKSNLLIQNEESLKEALKFANACGAITVEKKGAIPALPTKEDVQEVLASQTSAWAIIAPPVIEYPKK